MKEQTLWLILFTVSGVYSGALVVLTGFMERGITSMPSPLLLVIFCVAVAEWLLCGSELDEFRYSHVNDVVKFGFNGIPLSRIREDEEIEELIGTGSYRKHTRVW
jgi:hypothetical protein